MQRGPKPQLPAVKLEKGTYQPCRDGNRMEIVAPDELPQKPDWLTAAGEEVWMEDIGRAAQVRLLSEADATMFANYCNLQGCIMMAWRAVAIGAPEATPPPISALEHVRKLQEYFGIAGAKSRVVKIEKGGPSGNPSASSSVPLTASRSDLAPL